MIGKWSMTVCAAAALLCSASAYASPLSNTYTFKNISNSAPGASGYSVEVTTESLVDGSLPSNQVAFIFRNNSDPALGSSIKGVYFQNGTLLEIAQVNDSLDTVSFSEDANPSQLPGGEDYGFLNTSLGGATFSADADPSPFNNGVQSGEWLEIVFNLKSGKSYGDVIDAINTGLQNPFADGALLIGLHVLNFDGNDSASLVLIPLPAPALMGLAGLAAVVVLRRRRWTRPLRVG